jgi:hypothetical protein
MKIGLLCVLTVLAGDFARLEILSAQQGLNKFALKSKLYINAIRQAFDELQQLKSATA